MIPAAVDFAERDDGTDGERSAGAGGTASTAAGNAASSGGAALPSPPPPPGTASPPSTAAAASTAVAAQHPAAAAGSVAPPVFADQNRCWIASHCFFLLLPKNTTFKLNSLIGHTKNRAICLKCIWLDIYIYQRYVSM